MYIENDKHIESAKINHLSERASHAFYAKEHSLLKTFGLVNDEGPRTAADIVKRIQDGKFVLKAETKDRKTYSPTDYIMWRDPSVKEDQDGYDAALKDLQKVYTDTKDTIMVGTPAEGLAAVKALDAWTPTVATPVATA